MAPIIRFAFLLLVATLSAPMMVTAAPPSTVPLLPRRTTNTSPFHQLTSPCNCREATRRVGSGCYRIKVTDSWWHGSVPGRGALAFWMIPEELGYAKIFFNFFLTYGSTRMFEAQQRKDNEVISENGESGPVDNHIIVIAPVTESGFHSPDFQPVRPFLRPALFLQQTNMSSRALKKLQKQKDLATPVDSENEFEEGEIIASKPQLNLFDLVSRQLLLLLILPRPSTSRILNSSHCHPPPEGAGDTEDEPEEEADHDDDDKKPNHPSASSKKKKKKKGKGSSTSRPSSVIGATPTRRSDKIKTDDLSGMSLEELEKTLKELTEQC
ncbi:hypothetical protein BC938DRAFT_473933, partial [Jimgerdemannia flammicorona]